MPENPQILGCRFLDVLVLIRGFLLYHMKTIFVLICKYRKLHVALKWIELVIQSLVYSFNSISDFVTEWLVYYFELSCGHWWQ